MEHDSSSSARDPLERLAAEFLDRRRRGEDPSPSEYAERYPQWAEQILEFFPALELMEGLKPHSGDRTDSMPDRVEAAATPRLEQLGEYRILREIGHGGMGVVYEAIQESLGRRVALKILPLHGRIDQVQIERFQLESRSAARLHHGNIVPVHGMGEHQGVYYYAMQYIAGHGLDVILDDLRRLRVGAAAPPAAVGGGLKDDTGSVAVARSLLTGRFGGSQPDRDRGGLTTTAPDGPSGPRGDRAARPSAPAVRSSVLSDPTELGYYRAVARIGVQVASALAHAHGQGVLHRDIKPSNLLLDADGHVWVADFGLAKLEDAEGPTHTGDIVGTLRYMAPERFEGWSDRRSDLYGLGMTMYELLTLHPAFEAATRAKLIEQVIYDPPPPPRKSDPRIPRDLETIVLKAIAKEPGERYATAAALAADLENYLADKPIAARRSSLPERTWRWCRRNPSAAGLLATSAVAVLALVGLAVGFVFHTKLRSEHLNVIQARESERSMNVRLNRALQSEQNALRNEVGARKSEASIRYFNNMIMAEREWSSSNVRRAEQLLDECLPKPGQADGRGWEWHYLKRQCHTELAGFHSRFGIIVGLVYCLGGQRLLLGNDEVCATICDANTGEVLHELGGHSHRPWAVAASQDGRVVATASGDESKGGEVKLWDAETGRELGHPLRENVGDGSSLSFSPDGKHLAVASGERLQGSVVTVWNLETRTKIYEIAAAKGDLSFIDVAFSPDGKYLAMATGAWDLASIEKKTGTVVIRDASTGKELISVCGHDGPLSCLAYSPDGRLIATAGWDNLVKVWNAQTGEELLTFAGHAQRTNRLAFSPDSRRIASGGEDNSVKVWDARTGQEYVTLRGHTREVYGVSWHPDGRRIATAGMDEAVKVWDADSSKEALTLSGHSDSVSGIAFDPNRPEIASVSMDGTLRLWHTGTGRLLRTMSGMTEPLWDVTYSLDGTSIAFASGDRMQPETIGQVRIWEKKSNMVVRSLRAHFGLAWCVAYSPDGKHIATAGGVRHKPGEIKIWKAATGQEVQTFLGTTNGYNFVNFSPDGRLLASTCYDQTVKVWDVQTGSELRGFKGHTDFVFEAMFSPDGQHLASTGTDGVRIWDVRTGELARHFRGHKCTVICVGFTPDGTRIASGGDDFTVKVWDPETGQEALTLRGHKGTIWRVAFSPDGKLLASASRDGTVRIWDGTPRVQPTGRAMRELPKDESR
jgi:WD40 repeat protein/serine/threonine protein kinase